MSGEEKGWGYWGQQDFILWNLCDNWKQNTYVPTGARTVHAHSLSCVWLFATSWTVAHQMPLSMEFSRPGYWSGFSIPSPGDFSDPGIKPSPSASPALQVDSLSLSYLGSPAYGGEWPKAGMEEMVMAIVILIQTTITKSPNAFFLHVKGRVLRV